MENTRVSPVLSDLFFNYTHTEYDALFGKSKEGPSNEEMEAAIIADAKDFVECYKSVGEIGYYTGEDFANDFLARL